MSETTTVEQQLFNDDHKVLCYSRMLLSQNDAAIKNYLYPAKERLNDDSILKLSAYVIAGLYLKLV